MEEFQVDGKKQFTMFKENIINLISFCQVQTQVYSRCIQGRGDQGIKSSQVILIVLYCIYHKDKGCNVAVDDVLAEDCCCCKFFPLSHCHCHCQFDCLRLEQDWGLGTGVGLGLAYPILTIVLFSGAFCCTLYVKVVMTTFVLVICIKIIKVMVTYICCHSLLAVPHT